MFSLFIYLLAIYTGWDTKESKAKHTTDYALPCFRRMLCDQTHSLSTCLKMVECRRWVWAWDYVHISTRVCYRRCVIHLACTLFHRPLGITGAHSQTLAEVTSYVHTSHNRLVHCMQLTTWTVWPVHTAQEVGPSELAQIVNRAIYSRLFTVGHFTITCTE